MTEIYKVLITAPWFTDTQLRRLTDKFDVRRNNLKRWFTEEELIELIPDYDAVIAGLDPFTEEVINKGKKLKIIARRGIGYDKIDLNACRRRGIFVSNTPVIDEHYAVAEFTVGLILMATKNMQGAHSSLISGSWEREAFIGRNLRDLTVGILGLGNIGIKVAKLIRSFGSQVIYYDPYVNCNEFQNVDIHTLFKTADVVSVHLPLTKETFRIVDYNLLRTMKVGSYLVNTSRSETIVKEDLFKSVEGGKIKMVALDVFDNEPPLSDEIHKDARFFETPHIAAFTKESFNKIDETCVDNVINVLIEKKKPDYLVT